MKKKKQPDEPEVIRFENHLEPNWTHRVNLTERDAWTLAAGIVPDWMQRLAEFCERDNPRPSDAVPGYQTYEQEAAALEKSA